MTPAAKLNELNSAEDPARKLLERLGYEYVPREVLAAEREGEREVLLKGRLTAALRRLNEWMTEDQAQRVIFNLQHVDAHRPRAQPGDPHLPRLRHAAHDRPRGPAGDADRPLLRLRPPRARRRPQRVRRHHPVPRAPRQRARRRFRGRREGHQARPRAVRERHPPRRDGGEVAYAAGGLEDQGGEAAATLPGGRTGVARRRRAGAVRHQPHVRRPLRGGRGLRHPRRSRERLRRLEVDRAAHRRGVRAPLRRAARGPGTAHRRPAQPSGVARHPAGFRRLPAGARGGS